MVVATALWLPLTTHAFFEDSEARKHLLDLRTDVREMQTSKADKSDILSLLNQNEALREELAILRGQLEMIQIGRAHV